MGGDLLWEDLLCTCGLAFLCLLLNLPCSQPWNVCTSGPTACTLVQVRCLSRLAVRHLLVVDSECLSAYKCADVLYECVDICRCTSYEVSDMLLSLSRCVLP